MSARPGSIVACMALWSGMAGPVSAGETGEPRQVHLLVVTRVLERPDHIFIHGAARVERELREVEPNPNITATRHAALVRRATSLNSTFVNTMTGFDRDTAMNAAIERAFTRHGNVFDFRTSTDGRRYLTSGTAKPTAASAEENVDYVLAIADEFFGLESRHYIDSADPLLIPSFYVAYALHDVRNGKVVARGKAASKGLFALPAQRAVTEREFFAASWPRLCTTIMNTIHGELLRNDSLHAMAQSVGRGTDVPAVSAKLAEFARRIEWELQPAGGWRERRLNTFTRVMEPKGDLSERVRMRIDVDFLIPELDQAVDSVDTYLPIFEALRREQTPEASPFLPFDQIIAPGFSPFTYATPGGGHNVVLFRKSDESMMEIYTVTLSADAAKLYPHIRPQLEAMLASSRVRLK